jgi:hypothetical protein
MSKDAYKFTFPLLLWKNEEDKSQGLMGGTFIWHAEKDSIEDNFFTQCTKVNYYESIAEEFNRYSKSLKDKETT